MAGLGEAVELLKIGLALAKHVRKKDDKSSIRDLVRALRVIYFDASLVEKLESVRAKDGSVRKELARKIELKLLDGRYEVRRSLLLIESELDGSISLKQQRLFTSISHSKTSIRNEIFRALRSDSIDKVDEILNHISALNEAIEEIEDRLQSRLDER